MKWFMEMEIKDVSHLRSAYKKLLVQYHPDNNREKDTTSILQEINAEYEILFRRLKEGFEHSENYQKATDKTKQFYDWKKDRQIRDMIEKLCRFPGIEIEVCGIWIYVRGNTYLYKKELKGLGLTWNRQKKCWIIHWDDYYKRNSHVLSMDKIRTLYGSSVIMTEEEESTKYITKECAVK